MRDGIVVGRRRIPMSSPTHLLGVWRSRSRRVRGLAIVVVVLLAIGGIALLSFTQEPMRAAIWQRQAQRCGQVVAVNNQPPRQIIGSATMRQAEDCFMNGYARCQPVTLAYTTGAIDSFTTDTFVVEPAEGQLAGCGLANAWQGDTSGRGYSGTNRCVGAMWQADGLHVRGCAGGEDIIIPSS